MLWMPSLSQPPAVFPHTCLPPAAPQVPTPYFEQVLGPHKKYSCCLYNTPGDSLEQAEQNMLGE